MRLASDREVEWGRDDMKRNTYMDTGRAGDRESKRGEESHDKHHFSKEEIPLEPELAREKSMHCCEESPGK